MRLHSIAPLIQGYLPDYYKTEGPGFIAFLKAYYEWLESTGNPLEVARNITSYRDIDKTLDQFLEHFRSKYLSGLPPLDNIADERTLIKHIKEVYASKGSERGLQLLFQLLFNKEIQTYTPGDDILRLSAGTWTIPEYIELQAQPSNYLLVGEAITGSISGATAIVESMFEISTPNGRRMVAQIGALRGRFMSGEIINSGVIGLAPTVSGSLTSVVNIGSSTGFRKGDLVDIAPVPDRAGTRAVGVVSETGARDGSIVVEIEDGGSGYSLEHSVVEVWTPPGSSGNGAIVEVEEVSTDVSEHTYDTKLYQQVVASQFEPELNDFLLERGFNQIDQFSISVSNAAAIPPYGPVKLNDTIDCRVLYRDATTELLVGSTLSTGTVSTTSGSTAVSGIGTSFTSEYIVGDEIQINGASYIIATITDDLNLTTTVAQTTTLSGVSHKKSLSQTVNVSASGQTITVATGAASLDKTFEVGSIVWVDDGSSVSEYTVTNVTTTTLTVDETPVGDVSAATFGIKEIRNIIVLETDGTVPVVGDSLKFSTYTPTEITDVRPEAQWLPYFTTRYLDSPGVWVVDRTAADLWVTVSGIAVPADGAAFNFTYDGTSYTATVFATDATSKAEYDTGVSSGNFDIGLIVSSPSWVDTTPDAGLFAYPSATFHAAYLPKLIIAVSGQSDTQYKYGAITKLRIRAGGRNYSSTAEVFAMDLSNANYATGYGLNAIIEATGSSGVGAINSIRVLDSGYSFVDGEDVSITARRDDSLTSVGTAKTEFGGFSQGFFTSNSGFLSSNKKIQDNHYYQEYSYDVKVGLSFDRWSEAVRKIWHPSGVKMFGTAQFVLHDERPFINTSMNLYTFTVDNAADFNIGDVVTDANSTTSATVVSVGETTITAECGVDEFFYNTTALVNTSNGQTYTVTALTYDVDTSSWQLQDF